MNEQAVEETLGAHMALSSRAAEIWREVAHGERSADAAVAAVLDERARVTDEEREELERARLVFAPPAQVRQEALLEALLAKRQAEQAVVSLAERVAPKGTRSGQGRVIALVAVAIAAALVLWLLPGKQGAFVGRYTLELSGMTADMRSKAPEPKPGEFPSFRIDARIKVELTPEDDVAGPLEVVGFARGQSGEVRPLSFGPVVHPSGKIDIDVPVRALELPEGTWELVFAVGRTGEVPRSWEGLGANAVGYVVVRGTVQIVPEP
jgi:hypothetical protein